MFKEIGTLSEIGAQVGDVVYNDVSDTTFTLSSIGNFMAHGKTKSPCYSDENDCWHMCGISTWRIISRTQSAHTGPVITETVTRKRIVPGVYGKVRINAAFPDQGVAYVGIIPCEEEQGRCYGLSRSDLIAARDVFNQLIDAME